MGELLKTRPVWESQSHGMLATVAFGFGRVNCMESSNWSFQAHPAILQRLQRFPLLAI